MRLGVRVGLPLTEARRLCPDAAFRRGDLAAYGRVSDEVTAVLLSASRRVERPSADEAFVDLTPDASGPPGPAAERIRDELPCRLGLDASLGVASSRLAARIASGWARPRGLLVVLPGTSCRFSPASRSTRSISRPTWNWPSFGPASPRSARSRRPTSDGRRGRRSRRPARLRAAARAEDETPVAVATPPASVQEETPVRDRHNDRHPSPP